MVTKIPIPICEYCPICFISYFEDTEDYPYSLSTSELLSFNGNLAVAKS